MVKNAFFDLILMKKHRLRPIIAQIYSNLMTFSKFQCIWMITWKKLAFFHFLGSKYGQFKKISKNLPKKHFLLLTLTSSKGLGPRKLPKRLKPVILHSIEYGFLEKSEIWGFWRISLLGFFHLWANSAVESQAGSRKVRPVNSICHILAQTALLPLLQSRKGSQLCRKLWQS